MVLYRNKAYTGAACQGEDDSAWNSDMGVGKYVFIEYMAHTVVPRVESLYQVAGARWAGKSDRKISMIFLI